MFTKLFISHVGGLCIKQSRDGSMGLEGLTNLFFASFYKKNPKLGKIVQNVMMKAQNWEQNCTNVC